MKIITRLLLVECLIFLVVSLSPSDVCLLTHGFQIHNNNNFVLQFKTRMNVMEQISSATKSSALASEKQQGLHLTATTSNDSIDTKRSKKQPSSFLTASSTWIVTLSIVLSIIFSVAVDPASAKDFAGKDISGKDFSNQNLTGKDFTKAIAKETNFAGSNLQGAQFSKAILEKADFTNANLDDANLDDAVLDGAVFKEVTARKATLSKTILDIGDLENVDFTNALWPSKFRIMICDMDELKGTNTVTGADSRASFYCQERLFSN